MPAPTSGARQGPRTVEERSGPAPARRRTFLVSHVISTFWWNSTRLFRIIGLWPYRSPGRLLIAPPDIRTADPTVAADIYGGYFVFGGKAVNTHGRSPFAVPAPSLAWAMSLADFGWLRHLRAADTSLARVNARALVSDWIMQEGRPRDVPAWSLETASRRTLAWLSQSPIILDGADGFFYRRFMQSLGRHAAFLRRAISTGPTGEARLFAAMALTELGLCAEGFGKLQRQATRALLEEIASQILPDGGHVSRNPAAPVELLLFLLPLRQAFIAAGVAPPPPLLNAIDRMMPMIRTLRHGDRSLALFNGMGVTRPESLATVLAYDDTRGRPLRNAPYSGYQRLEAAGSIVLVDAGAPPPVAFSREAHAGTLSFEFSVGPQQVVVNCGAPDAGGRGMREAARATAAHSTLTLADRSSSRFVKGGRFARGFEGLLLAGPGEVTVQRADENGAITLDVSHDGYASRFGLLHRRRLALSAAGERLAGVDHLAPMTSRRRWRRGRNHPARAFALRFHLHPSIRTRLIREGAAALIALPSGELWMFEAGGLPVGVEESIYFGSPDGARRTDQIVVAGDSGDLPRIAWSLSRWDGAAPAEPVAGELDELPTADDPDSSSSG